MSGAGCIGRCSHEHCAPLPDPIDVPVATEREALERATLDYLAALDTVIEVDQIGCAGDWRTYDPPVRVRVIQTDNADVYHWDIGTGADDDYLDPYWNVELVAPHPSILADAHLYVHAPRSYFLPHALHAPKGGR